MQREPKMSLSQIEAMRSGARTAVRTCMGVTPNDRVFVLTDRVTERHRPSVERRSRRGGRSRPSCTTWSSSATGR